MEDFLLDIEAKITVRPVTPKTGLVNRPPFERNMYVVTEKARKHFYGTKAQVATLASNAKAVMEKGWNLGTIAPPEVFIGSASSITHESATAGGVVIPNYGDGSDLTITIEYGTTMALGTSDAVDAFCTTTIGENTTLSPDREIAVSAGLTGLAALTQYFWRIKVVNSTHYTVWSQVKTFKTAATP